jgi:hypothetical protein
MRSFLWRPSYLRNLLPALTFAVVLGACTMPANNGFSPTRDNAMPYPQANAQCWEQAYGAPSGGGSSQFGSAMGRYDSCMSQVGWQRSKSAF